mgnify:CR=1 FL=1
MSIDPASLRAISFDLDDTLWETPPVIARAERAMYAWLDEHHPRITARYSERELVELRQRIAREEPRLGRDLGVLRKVTLRRAARACGCPESLAEPAFAAFYAWRNRVTLFEHALPTLEKLARRYPLVAVTNGNSDLAAIGIGQHFRLCLSPSLARRPKPHPDLFDDLCAALALRAEQLLHVGDNPRTDVGGARAAGARTAWFNPAGARWPAELRRAEVEITCLSELPRLLDAE